MRFLDWSHVVPLVLATTGVSCVSEGCPSIGCGEFVALEVLRAGTPEELADLTLRVCVNATCGEGSDTQNGGALSGALTGNYGMQGDGAGYKLAVSLHDRPAVFANGDVYTVEVMSSTGTLISTQRWSATYEEYGYECAGLCRRAILTSL